jgi:hypothetical protein
MVIAEVAFGAELAEVVSRNERAGPVETRSKLIRF